MLYELYVLSVHLELRELRELRQQLFSLEWYSGGAVPPTVTDAWQKRQSVGGTAPSPYQPVKRWRCCPWHLGKLNKPLRPPIYGT